MLASTKVLKRGDYTTLLFMVLPLSLFLHLSIHAVYLTVAVLVLTAASVIYGRVQRERARQEALQIELTRRRLLASLATW